MIKNIMIFVLLMVPSLSCLAKVFQLNESLPRSFSSPRFMYEQGKASFPRKGVPKHLWKVRDARNRNDWGGCLSAIDQVRPRAKGLSEWLTYAELTCLINMKMSEPQNLRRLSSLLNSISGDTSSLVFFTAHELTRPVFLKAIFLCLKSESKVSRKQAWQRIRQIQKLDSFLDRNQKGVLYRAAGDLAFIEQNLLASWDFYRRSLEYDKRSDLNKKIELIRRSLGMSTDGSGLNGEESGGNPLAVFSQQEIKLVDQMKKALRAKDYLSAAQDGVELIKDFPGSKWADWASDQVLKVYLGVVNKSDVRYATIRKKVLRTMKSADAKRLLRWARNAWARGAYADVVFLADMAVDKIQPHPDEGKLLLLGGNSAVSAGDYVSAKEMYKRLTRRFAGTKEAVEGLFRFGLLYFRLEDYSRAASQFEKLLANREDESFRLESMYWSWRSYQNEKRSGADSYAKQLIKEYPLTYYGLRARAEMNAGWLKWSSEELGLQRLEVQLTFTERENRSKERYLLLLNSGWLEESQLELSRWPKPVSAEQQLLYASYWGASLNHYKAIKLINEAWEQRPELLAKMTIDQAFPTEFSKDIKREASQYQLDPNIIYALIRQESSFRPRAVSPANAAGLMQIVPATARDIAKFIKWKPTLRLPEDMLKPSQNIKFGASYLKRMVRAFDNHLPLALAAYNAGIGRTRRWLAARSDTGVDQKKLTSNHRTELWIDELPWSETRYYVKAILRNYLIYQWLDKNEFNLPEPVWGLDTVK